MACNFPAGNDKMKVHTECEGFIWQRCTRRIDHIDVWEKL
jgi:hypothetical protein